MSQRMLKQLSPASVELQLLEGNLNVKQSRKGTGKQMQRKIPWYPSGRTRRYAWCGVALLIVFALYVSTGYLGLSLGAVSGFATLVWFPSGLAVTALLLFGSRLWPAIFLGAALVNYTTGAPLLVATGIGIGNTLEALACAELLRHWWVRSTLEELRDVLLLVLLAAPISTFISATVGVGSLLLGGTIAWSAAPATWSAWWVGDLISILILVPLLLTWQTWPLVTHSCTQMAELSLLVLCMLVIGCFVFLGLGHPDHRSYSLTYLVLPPLVWAALRFGPRGASAASAAFAGMAVVGTIWGVSPFSTGSLSERLFFLQGFMGITTATTLILAAVMAERHTLEQRKDAFISLASHELKTPLTVLKLQTALLHRQLAKQGIQDSAPALSKMEVQLNTITRLVEELLDVSKIQAGRLEYRQEMVNLDALLREIAETMQYIHPSHRILMHGAVQASLMADRDRLGQVFINLLSNAIKYSPETQTVEMDISASPETATIRVHDHGLGIPREQRDKIFERFYRVSDPQQRAIPGLGMGLYIVAEIVKHHGGTISVESEVGRGSIFTVTLPRTRKT